MLRIQTFLSAILIFGSVPASHRAQRQASDLKEVKNAGVSFVYSDNDFAGMEIEKQKKQTAQDISEDVPIGVAPEHFCFRLKDKRPLPSLDQGPRYFFPAYSFICAIPLKDSSVKNFGVAYPDLHKAALNLQKILRARPGKLKSRKNIPDIPFNNSSPSILSRFQYLNFRSGTGIMFLTQYSQEMEGNPVNNEELTLNFQGITKDRRYYIAARLAITHPSLPKGIDFTNDIKRDKQHRYLRKAQNKLEGLSEESFEPSLKSLKALLSSVRVE